MGNLIDISANDFITASTTSRSKKAIDELYDELQKIEDEFMGYGEETVLPDFDMPDSLEQDEMTFEEKTEQELEEIAKAQFENAYNEKVQKLNEQADLAKQQSESKKENILQQVNKKQEDIENDYENAKQSFSNQALKRGLARSSVIMQQMEDIENSKIKNKGEAFDSALVDISAIDDKINDLDLKLKIAVDNEDISLQNDISNKLMQLFDDQEKKFNDVLKYNNTLKEKQADYLKDKQATLLNRVKTQLQANKEKDALGNPERNKEFLDAKFNAVRGFLDGLSKADAKNILNGDSKIKNALGVYYNMMKALF